MIRIAAVCDIHVGTAGTDLVELWADLDAHADVLLLAGDLTRVGTAAEAEVVAAAVATVPVPVVAVLGNHDVHSGAGPAVAAALERAGATVLEGTGYTLEVAGTRVGVAGVKGFGGGFPGSSCAAATPMPGAGGAPPTAASPPFHVARPVLGAPFTVLSVDPARCRQRQNHDAVHQAAQRDARG